MPLFDGAHITSYLHSRETMRLSCIIFRYIELSIESRKFFVVHLYLAIKFVVEDPRGKAPAGLGD